mmetsp:Transcript_4636/g.13243  ORF Transcript_4636/g.13243 Transcript_4636/m.13243 type:complete len:201 (+) Transcript_4636:181-783(+)
MLRILAQVIDDEQGSVILLLSSWYRVSSVWCRMPQELCIDVTCLFVSQRRHGGNGLRRREGKPLLRHILIEDRTLSFVSIFSLHHISVSGEERPAPSERSNNTRVDAILCNVLHVILSRSHHSKTPWCLHVFASSPLSVLTKLAKTNLWSVDVPISGLPATNTTLCLVLQEPHRDVSQELLPSRVANGLVVLLLQPLPHT